ncbi:MAG: ATP-grasp domain-containing protein [Bacteroidota bacterium]
MNGIDRIILLFGGTSDERLVSVASAQNLLGVTLDDHGAPTPLEMEPWFIHPDGRAQACGARVVLAHARPFETPFVLDEPSASRPSLEAGLDSIAPSPGTVFLLAVHGGQEEDGTLQRRLEAGGVSFTGSGSEASALCFDKQGAKAVVRRHGVEVARGEVLHGGAAGGGEAGLRGALSDSLRDVGPVIVKPVRGGSSLGLHYVLDRKDIEPTAAAVARSSEPFLMEELVTGTEVSIGVIEHAGELRALPGTEIRVAPGSRFDYEGKYLGKGVREVTPAEIAPARMAEAQRVAVLAHRVFGCAGYSRTDVIIRDDGTPVFLETNSLPGLTQSSLVPQQLAAAGISLSSFLSTQLTLAAKRNHLRGPF